MTPITPQLDLLVIGDLNFDYLGRIPFFPKADEEVEIAPLDGYLGGSGANAAVVATRLGLSVDFYSAVGQDVSGTGLINLLTQAGVPADHIKTVKNVPSGMVFGLIDTDGDRRLFCFRGANLELYPQDISDETITAAKRLHLNGPEYNIALDLLTRSRKLGVPNSMDPGSILIGEHADEMGPILAQTDVLFVNHVEFANLTKGGDDLERAAWLHRTGVKWVVLKNGEQGSQLFSADAGAVSVPAFEIHAVDATGAGDAFNAAFLYALIHHFEVPEILKFANAVGAMAASAVGATSGVPGTIEPVWYFIRSKKQRSQPPQQHHQ
jgi:ribokinase